MTPVLLFFGFCFLGIGDCDNGNQNLDDIKTIIDPENSIHSDFIQEFENDSTATLINDTGVIRYIQCSDIIELANGVWCKDEQPRELDVYNDIVLLSSSEFRDLKSLNVYKFNSNVWEDDIFFFISGCKAIGGYPNLKVWDSSKITAKADCVEDTNFDNSTEKSKEDVIIEKLNELIQLHKSDKNTNYGNLDWKRFDPNDVHEFNCSDGTYPHIERIAGRYVCLSDLEAKGIRWQ